MRWKQRRPNIQVCAKPEAKRIEGRYVYDDSGWMCQCGEWHAYRSIADRIGVTKVENPIPQRRREDSTHDP